MSNVFQVIAFKKHIPQLLNERSMKRKKLNQFTKNVSLHTIDCIYENSKQYSSIGDEFTPEDVDSTDKLLKIVNVSNSNLAQNASNLLMTLSIPNEDLVWVGASKKCFDYTKFKLNYKFYALPKFLVMKCLSLVYLY